MSAGQLFVLPNQVPLSATGTLQAGAKAYFYETTTSNPLDTYQDQALSVLHAHPVVADANGAFPPIWLLATPKYRLVLKDANDVTLRTVDGLGPLSAGDLTAATLAGDNLFTGNNTLQRSDGSQVRLLFDEFSAGADKRLWDIAVQGGVFKIRTRTDADGTGADLLTATRGAATAVTTVNLAGSTWQYLGNTLATVITGNFTATITGMTAGTTGLVKYRIAGGICTLYVDASITGTSNTTDMTLTGLPTACQPVTTGQRNAICYGVSDATQTLQALATVDGTGAGSPGTITFTLFNTNAVSNRIQAGTAFTASGTKGLIADRFLLVYPL